MRKNLREFITYLNNNFYSEPWEVYKKEYIKFIKPFWYIKNTILTGYIICLFPFLYIIYKLNITITST